LASYSALATARSRRSTRKISRPGIGPRGASAAYQVAQVYGGGLIPIIAGQILRSYGIHEAYVYIGLLAMAYAVLAILAILATPETRNADLEGAAAR